MRKSFTRHKDFTGRYLAIGDKVVYVDHTRTSSQLQYGEVIGETTSLIKLRAPNDYRGFFMKVPCKMMLLEPKEQAPESPDSSATHRGEG